LNGEINAPEIRLVGVDGEQLGIVSLTDALAKAEAAELDLVEIAPMAKPPVCRIMDYGKFKYREAKKQHEAKLKLKQIQVKEVKFRPGTDEGDYKIKLRNLTRFLSGYTAAVDPWLIPSGSALQKLLAVFELEKAVYELRYELNNRPDWIGIPVAGIVRMLDEEVPG